MEVFKEVAALIRLALLTIPAAVVGVTDGESVLRDLFCAIVGGGALHLFVGDVRIILDVLRLFRAVVLDVLSLILVELIATVVGIF